MTSRISWLKTLLGTLLILFLGAASTFAAVRINTLSCSKTTVSKGQTGIQVFMEVENLDAAPCTLTAATLTFSLGTYELTLNTPALGAVIAANGKVTCGFTLSVSPLSNSGVCVIDGEVTTSGGSDVGADLTHSWVVQQPSELVVTSIVGPSFVTRGSGGNQAIMDVSRTGEADVQLNAVALAPYVPTNYANLLKTSPTLPQSFAKSYWWNTRWPYRRQMTIGNRSATLLPATYEIRFTFDHKALVDLGKSLPTGDDVRVVYDNGAYYQEVQRYLDPMESAWGSTTTTIWFRLKQDLGAAPASTDRYAIYYGASALDSTNPPNDPMQVFIFNENCEGADPGWTTSFLAGYATTRWERGSINTTQPGDPDGFTHPPNTTVYWPNTTAFSPTRCWATDLDAHYRGRNPQADVIWLYSPTINLVGKLNPSLSFYNWMDIEDPTTPYDWGMLKVYQESTPRPGLLLRTLLNRHIKENTTGQWRKETMSLTPEAGKNVYLEYLLHCDQLVCGFGWAIDDIRIRQVASPEPNNPILGVEENVPLVPTIKAYFDVDIAPTAVAGNDTIDGSAQGTEANSGLTITDNSATLPLRWFIRSQDFNVYGNPYYVSPKDRFNINEYVYAKGTGYATGTSYIVRWLNPSGNEMTRGVVVPNDAGEIFHHRTMLSSDMTGLWTVMVENTAGSEVFATIYFNLNVASQLVSEFTMPPDVVIGQQFLLTEKVTNTGQTTAVGVTPSSLTQNGAGTVVFVSGPNPSAQSIAGGESGLFTWTISALSMGRKSFRGNASGTIEGSANQVYSASASSNLTTIRSENCLITSVAAPDTTVNRGQSGLPVAVTLTNGGTADLMLASLSFKVTQGVDVTSAFPAMVVSPAIPCVIKGAPYPGWWNANYLYRQKLQLKGDGNLYAASCTARITIKTDDLRNTGKLLANRNDWRVVRWDDNAGTWTELDRHVVNSESTAFCIRAPIDTYAIEESYYVYYGNAAAGAPPQNRNLCYLFFEDWESPDWANGRYAAATWNAATGFPEWRFNEGTPVRDGIYLTNNAGVRARDVQTVGFQKLRFAAAPSFTGPFASIQRRFNTLDYPMLKFGFWYWFGGGAWDGGVQFNWGRVNYWDGTANTTLMTLASNGPNDSTLHAMEYDLSGVGKSAISSFSFEANFYYANGSELYFDDISAWMDAPIALGQGEETNPVTTLIATLAVSISDTAPAGVVTLDAGATCTSILASGTISDVGAGTTDSWTIQNQVLQTYSDPGCLASCTTFSAGQPVYVKGSGFPAGNYDIRWYDAYPSGGNNPFSNLTVPVGVPGTFVVNQSPATAGMWLLKVTGPQTASGSFRITRKPELVPQFYLSPATSTLNDILVASLTVHASPDYEDFGGYGVGNLTVGTWTPVAGGGSVRIEDTVYSDNPPTSFLTLFGPANTTMRASHAWNLREFYDSSLSFAYSTVFAGGASFTVEVSANGGGTWTTLATYTTSLGTGVWSIETVSLPAALYNNPAAQMRFSLVTDTVGPDRVCIDNVFLKGISPNFEAIRLEPVTWLTDPSGSGNAVVRTPPAPLQAVVSCGTPANFTADFTPTGVTAVGAWHYLHGAGTPVVLASGASLADGGPWNLPDSRSSGVRIYQEAISVAPALVDLGIVNPGSTATPKNLVLSNTGNITLTSVDWELHNLASDPYFIPFSAIYMNPKPVGTIALAGSKTCSATVTIPPATNPGTYTALQFSFEDNDLNANSNGEAIGQFAMRVNVPVCERLQAATSSLFLGSWMPGNRTATTSVMVSNIGNVNLNLVRFLVPNFWLNGNDPARIIASSNVTLSPVVFGYTVAGDNKWQTFSVVVSPAPMAGTYLATATFLDDKNANGLVDPGEASSTVILTLSVATSENMSIGSLTIDLGTRNPGELASSGNVRLRNLGTLALENLRFAPKTLWQSSGESIPASFISFLPNPVPTLTSAGVTSSTTFQVFLNVPFGQLESQGGHKYGEDSPLSDQLLFNDKNRNGVWDAGEVATPCRLLIKVSRISSFTVAEEVANFGAGLTGDTLRTTVDVISIGNDKSQKLKWAVTGNALTSGANSIPFTPGAGTFAPYAGAGWLLNVPPLQTHQIATLTLTIPAVPSGIYRGQCRLYDDIIAPWNAYTAGEPFDDFELLVEVGNRGLNILETSPFSLGSTDPASSTASRIFTIQNTGQRTLTDLKYDKPDLDCGGIKIASSAFFFSAPDPIGLLNVGSIWAPSIVVNVPPNQAPGLYTGTLYVYQDENHDGILNGTDISDFLDIQVTVNSHQQLIFSPSPIDMGGINRGQSSTRAFFATNAGNVPLNSLSWRATNLTDGGNFIASSDISLVVPETPWNIPSIGITSELATLTVMTTPTTPTGNYTGSLIVWEDAAPFGVLDPTEKSWILPIQIAVGAKDLQVLQDKLDFGVVGKGDSSSVLSFTVRNTGTVFLSNTRIEAQAASGPGVIPLGNIHFSVMQVTPPVLNPGVNRIVQVSIDVPAGIPSGIYGSQQRIYEDLNGNSLYDAGEPTDTFAIEILVNSGGALSYELYTNPANVDFGVVPRGVSATSSFRVVSLCSNPLTNLQFTKADLTSGVFTLGLANLQFLPSTGFSIGIFGSAAATLTISVPPLQASGIYVGTQTVVDFDHPAASSTYIVRLSVPPANFTVSPTFIDFGYLPPGTGATQPLLLANVGSNSWNINWNRTPLLLNGVGPANIPIGSWSMSAASTLIGPFPSATAATAGVSIAPGFLPGTYIGTCTFTDLFFPTECSRDVSVRCTVISPMGDCVYQLITNASSPGAIASGESYFATVYVMATGTVNGDAVLQVREWLGNDQMTAAATHTVKISAAVLSANPGRWLRMVLPFTATTTANLGSFTIELGFFGGLSGQGLHFDGVQLEKVLTLPDGQRSTFPTPFTPHKGIVSPNPAPNMGDGRPYSSW